MGLLDALPHAFLVIILIVVGFFVLKSLIKFAIIVGLIGLAIYILWVMNIITLPFGG